MLMAVRDTETELSRLLADWHTWSQHYRYGKGYPSQDATCRGARASRQYDDTNGALDDALEDSTMEAFDAAANRVEQPYLTALQFQARNMATGYSVWTSPRLPTDELQRARMLETARNKLKYELAAQGVLA